MTVPVGPAPTPEELADWLRVAGPGTATGGLLWTPGDGDLAFGWVSFGELPLLLDLPWAVEVRFSWDGPRRWALDGPDGTLARCDGQRGVVWRDGQVEAGGLVLPVPDPEELLLPEPPDRPDGEVAADALLGRACWRWTASDGVRWVDDQTGCLLARRTPAGTLALTSFVPGAQVDPALFDLPPSEAPPPPRVTFQGPTAPAFAVPWWPHGALSYPVGGDPELPSLLVQVAPSGARAPSVWVGVAPSGQRAPVRPGVRSRRWDGEDCALSLSWRAGLSADDVDRVVASVPPRWP